MNTTDTGSAHTLSPLLRGGARVEGAPVDGDLFENLRALQHLADLSAGARAEEGLQPHLLALLKLCAQSVTEHFGPALAGGAGSGLQPAGLAS